MLDETSEKGALESTVLGSELQLAAFDRLTHHTDVTEHIEQAETLLQTSLIKLFAVSHNRYLSPAVSQLVVYRVSSAASAISPMWNVEIKPLLFPFVFW